MNSGQVWTQKLRTEIGKAVIGQNAVVERLLVALLANGHVLLEGMPGLAKTLLVRSLGRALGVQFERIQFTPDLLPSDVVGTMVFQPRDGQFTVHKGPVFANLVLADEINRAPAKVQSALLEAMQERQVTIGGTSHQLPSPFFVMATQNPIEQEGTYPLPEAQTDRFLFKLIVDYPDAAEERTMLDRWGSVTVQPELHPVSNGAELLALRKEVDAIHVSPAVQGYILALVRGTRELAGTQNDEGRMQNVKTGVATPPALPKPETRNPKLEGQRQLTFGASPRASLALLQGARALAWMRGQDFVTPALVQELAPDILRHRIGLTYEAEAAELTPDAVIRDLLRSVPVPAA
ncbi:MAG: MoxR family ATPase [Opitutaceae bacterium]|nr:MoxR family ATPase [Opitutaceae bacterium]